MQTVERPLSIVGQVCFPTIEVNMDQLFDYPYSSEYLLLCSAGKKRNSNRSVILEGKL